MDEILREKYAPLTGATTDTDVNLWDIIEAVSVQAILDPASTALSSNVLSQGRYVERALGEDRVKGSKIKSGVQALVGSDYFLRPNGEKYYTRDWGIHKDIMVLRKAREATIASVTTGTGSPMFALIYGAPGCGKTALIEASFADTGVRTLIGHGDIEVADMVGSYIQTPDGTFQWVDGDLIKAMENGETYFIDEIGLIDSKALAVLYGAMDGRREVTVTMNPERGTVKAHPDFYVVGATNPNAPGVRLSEALLSRFLVQAEMTTDWALARKLGVPAVLVTASQNLYKKQLSKQISWSPQMRELLGFRDIANAFGTEFAVANLISASPEIDRATVAELLSRAFALEIAPAKI